jgi:hypothetical protein
MKKTKPKLDPKDIRRFLDDGERKADTKGTNLLRVLSDAVQYGRRATERKATSLEVEAWWQRLYLVLTEIERDHRKLLVFASEMLQSAPDHGGLRFTVEHAEPVIADHDRLRAALSDGELLLIDFRRHSASHVSVDAYRIGLGDGRLVDGSKVTVLGGQFLTVAEKDALLDGVRSNLGDDNEGAARAIAERVLPVLEDLRTHAEPLHTARKWKDSKVHVIEDGDGTWTEIAKAAGVALDDLLTANGHPQPDAAPAVGKIITIPGGS